MGLIKRNIINKTEKEMLTLYKTLVRPKLDYSIQAWKPFLKKDILVMEKVQRKFTKIIKDYEDLKYSDRIIKLGLTKLEDRYNRADLLEVFKILNGNSGGYPENFLLLSKRKGRGNSRKLFKKRCRLEICKHSFTHRVVDLWNKLPDEVILSKDVKTFKCKLDCHTRSARGYL